MTTYMQMNSVAKISYGCGNFLSTATQIFNIVFSFVVSAISIGIVIDGIFPDMNWIIIVAGVIVLSYAAKNGVYDNYFLQKKLKQYVTQLGGQINAFSEQNSLFKTENDRLKNANEKLEENYEKYHQETNKLAKTVKTAEARIKSLNDLKLQQEKLIQEQQDNLTRQHIQFDEQKTELENNNQRLKNNNKKLQDNIAKMSSDHKLIISQYKKEAEELNKAIEKATSQVSKLEANLNEQRHQISLLDEIKNSLEQKVIDADEENQKLAVANEDFRKNNKKHEEQIKQLEILYMDSKKLIKNLILAGDTFSSFERSFANSSSSLASTSNMLTSTHEEMQETAKLLSNMVNTLAEHTSPEKQHMAERSDTTKEFQNLVHNVMDMHNIKKLKDMQ